MDSKSPKTYSIQYVSKQSGLSIPTLRYYEEIGLIPPVSRNPSSNHRRYDDKTVQLIETLANLRAVGMSLDEMRAYLPLRAKGDEAAVERREMFKQHAEIIEQEIAALKARQRYLTFKVSYWDARIRGDFAGAQKIAEEYESIVKDLRQGV